MCRSDDLSNVNTSVGTLQWLALLPFSKKGLGLNQDQRRFINSAQNGEDMETKTSWDTDVKTCMSAKTNERVNTPEIRGDNYPHSINPLVQQCRNKNYHDHDVDV